VAATKSANAAPSPAQGRLQSMVPIAVIDIGSNSVRLLIYEGATRSPTPLFNEKVMCGLGRSVAITNRIEGDSAARALAALARFRRIAEQLGAGKPWIMATAAVREAENGAEFVEQIEAVFDARVMVLTGQREGEMAGAGVQAGFERPDGIAGDLGGGSLELVTVPANRERRAITLPLGGLKLAQRAENDLLKAERLTQQDLDTVPWLADGAGRTFYAVGGTWRAIGKMHMHELNHPLQITHDYRIEYEQAIHYCELIMRGKRSRDGGPESRRDVLPLGGLVLKMSLERIRPTALVFSAFGIREGLLYTLLSRTEQIRDPLIAFCEEYALLRSRSPTHATELCSWTDALFVPPGPREFAGERRLRHAVCYLSDIAWRAHPDYRGEQALHTIIHSAMIGVDHPARAFIALSVYFRHARDPNDSPLGRKLLPLLSKASIKRARLLGASIRVAHMLSVGAAGIIPRLLPIYEGQSLVLRLPADLAILDGERLRKRLSVLGELLAVTPVVRTD
jgi:exopolyphosphatase / guanosine-5'-triphosphate,3'-diphosphate pyrophosphatase